MRRAAAFLLLCLLLAAPAFALDVRAEQSEALDTDALEAALPETAAEILGDVTVEDALQPEGALARLWAAAKDRLLTQLRRGAKSACSLLAVVVLCGVGESVAEGKSAEYIAFGGALGVCAVAAGDVRRRAGARRPRGRSASPPPSPPQ